jgi:hypothetical protein
MGKTKIAATAQQPLEAAICSDGMKVADAARMSAAGAGLTEQEWFRRFNDGVRAYGKQTGRPFLQSANITDAASMKTAIDGWYGKGGDPYNDFMNPMYENIARGQKKALGGKDFFYDTNWQYKTSARYGTSWKEWVPVSDKDLKKSRKRTAAKIKDGSWVEDCSGRVFTEVTKTVYSYIDPLTTSFIARKHAPLGGMYKITNPTTGKSTYAMVMERSPGKHESTRAEVSVKVGNEVGVAGSPNATTGSMKDGKLVLEEPKLKIEYLGQHTLPKRDDGLPATQPNEDQIQAEGKKLDPRAPKTPKASPPSASTGGVHQVIEGEASVRLGGLMLPAAFAGPACIHTGGGHVKQGSSSVFVGRSMLPFARVTDPTSDGFEVKTGEDSVEIA